MDFSFSPLHRHTDNLSEREKRLCHDHEILDLSHSQEVVTAQGEIQKNENLVEAMNLFTHEIATNGKYSALRNPLDETLFKAILLKGLMRSDPSLEYASIARNKLNVADAILSSDELRDMGISRVYAQSVWTNKIAGETEKYIPAIVAGSIDKYIQKRDELNHILTQHRIGYPDPSFAGAPALPERLSREEYFSLLLLMFQGLEGEVDTVASKGTTGVRSYLAESAGTSVSAFPVTGPLFTRALSEDRKRSHRILADVTVEGMGTAESLGRFKVLVGPEVRAAYKDAVTGVNSILAPGETAASWEQNPAKALLFFSRAGFTHTAESEEFINALNFYFSPDKPRSGAAPKMSEEDVRAMLHLVCQSLMEGQNQLAQGAERRIELREEVDFSRKVEQVAGSAWEYIKNFREHPVGSIAMGLLGFIAIRQLIGFIFPKKGEEPARWKVLLGWAALGGVAVGLYQKHTTGKAWYETLANKFGEKMEDWHLKEKKLPPEKQTLPNYWAKELDITDQQKLNCLSILEDQKAKDVLDWYGKMKQAKDNGEDISKRARSGDLQLPFETRKYRAVFGQKGKDEIASVFYESLQTFFKHRGEAILAGKIPYAIAGARNDPETAGYEYVRQRYLEHTFYYSMALATLEPVSVQTGVDAEKIMRDDKLWEEQQAKIRGILGDDLFFQLCVARSIYVREIKETNLSDINMWTIFMYEADPGGMKQYDGGHTSHLFAQLHAGGQKLATSINTTLGVNSLKPAVTKGGQLPNQPTTRQGGQPPQSPTNIGNPNLPPNPATAQGNANVPGNPAVLPGTGTLPGGPSSGTGNQPPSGPTVLPGNSNVLPGPNGTMGQGTTPGSPTTTPGLNSTPSTPHTTPGQSNTPPNANTSLGSGATPNGPESEPGSGTTPPEASTLPGQTNTPDGASRQSGSESTPRTPSETSGQGDTPDAAPPNQGQSETPNGPAESSGTNKEA